MAVSLLAPLIRWNGSDAFEPAVVNRLAGLSPQQIGTPFGILCVSETTPAVVGELLTQGGATARVTAILPAMFSSSHCYAVSEISGTWGSGAATGDIAASISVSRLVGPEDQSSLVYGDQTDRTVEFNGSLYTYLNWNIWRLGATLSTTTGAIGATIGVVSTSGFPTIGVLNVTTDAGVQTVTYTGISGNNFTGCSGGTGNLSVTSYVLSQDWVPIHTAVNLRSDWYPGGGAAGIGSNHTGLHIMYNSTATPFICAAYGPNDNGSSVYGVSSADGLSWNETLLAGPGYGGGGNPITGHRRELVYNNVLYTLVTTSIYSFDVLNGLYTRVAGYENGSRSDIIMFNNNLFYLTYGVGGPSANYPTVFQFIAGTWTEVLYFNEASTISSNDGTTTSPCMWVGGDGLLYAMFAIAVGSDQGWSVHQLAWNGITVVDKGQVQAQFLNGSGIPAFGTSGNSNFNGTSVSARMAVYTDDVTNPGTPAQYFYYTPNNVYSTSLTQFAWNSTITPTIQSLSGSTISVASTAGFPTTGTFSAWNGTDFETVTYTGITSTTFTGCSGGTGNTTAGGSVFSSLQSLGTGGTKALALPGAKTGGGEYMWSPAQPSIVITGVATALGGLTLSYMAFGGGTKSVSFYWGQKGQAPTKVAHLALGSATGNSSVVNGNTTQVDTVVADGTTTYMVKWNTGADGAVNLTRAQIQPTLF